MNATTAPVVRATIVAVDLAKSVFQLAVADGSWKVVESHRLTRTQFERWFVNRASVWCRWKRVARPITVRIARRRSPRQWPLTGKFRGDTDRQVLAGSRGSGSLP